MKKCFPLLLKYDSFIAYCGSYFDIQTWVLNNSYVPWVGAHDVHSSKVDLHSNKQSNSHLKEKINIQPNVGLSVNSISVSRQKYLKIVIIRS